MAENSTIHAKESHPLGSFSKVLVAAGIKPSPKSPARGCWGADGKWYPGSIAGGPPAYSYWKVGKKAAGAMLDGREHREIPA